MNSPRDTPDGVISHQRADEILVGRSTDSRRGDMVEHGGTLSHMDRTSRAVLLQDLVDSLFPNAATVVDGPPDTCQTCHHAPGCPNVSAGGFCMYHQDKAPSQ